MRSAVRRVSLMADERNRSIRLTIRDGEVEVTAQSSEEGEGREVVPADYKGEEMTLGFNWQYLQEFLNNVGANEITAAFSEPEAVSTESVSEPTTAATGSTDKTKATKETDGDKVRVRETAGPIRISFEFKDPNAQTQMSIAGDTSYNYKYIVMPLRI
jgi:DNA polymerase III sliding clamp (beta) subunit (PCNA family)